MDRFEPEPNPSELYICIPFCANMSGFHVTCGARYKDLTQDQLSRIVKPARAFFAKQLEGTAFRVDGSLNLRLLKNKRATANKYPPAAVAHRFYDAKSIPPDQTLLDEMMPLLEGYKKYTDAICSRGT